MVKRYIYNKNEDLVPIPIVGEASRNAVYIGPENPLTSEERSFFTGEKINMIPQAAYYPTSMQQGLDPQLYLNQIMHHVDATLNSSLNPDTYKIVYERETEKGLWLYQRDLIAWVYYERIETVRNQNNLHGGIAHTGKIKDKGTEVCGPIFFLSTRRFTREDKPGKHFYDVSYIILGKEEANNLSSFHVVVEYDDLSDSDFCDRIQASVVKPGKSKLCSMFFRSEILLHEDDNIEITIPSYPGWYRDDRYDWVYLHRGIYETLEDQCLPPAMRRTTIYSTDRTVNTVFSEIKQLIEPYDSLWQLFILSCIMPLQFALNSHGVAINQVIAPIINNLAQIQIVAAIFKLTDLGVLDIPSINKDWKVFEEEVAASRDGSAVICGPMTAAEAKINGKVVRILRDVAIGTNGTKISSRCMIILPCRFVPEALSQDYVLMIDGSDIPADIDIKQLRIKILEFHSAFISYIEKNYDRIEGIIIETLNSYKGKRIEDISAEKWNLILMVIATNNVMKQCFDIHFFNNDTWKRLFSLFQEVASQERSPDYTVRDQFFEAAYKLLRSGRFTIVELRAANKKYPEDTIALILDRKKGFLSFPMAAMEIIAEVIPTVKDGAELTSILKSCNTIFCTDNCARQITISGKRTAFYSVYLSEFEDDILDIIDFLEVEEFFFDPADVPKNFVPIIWHNGRCAGYVLDGKGLPNSHVNISGLSGMGKNRGAYKTSEGFWRLKSKVIFLDVKGGGTEESLRDMKCDLSRYCFHDLKKEGFPFPIFDLSSFSGNNAKVSYILNVIGAAVDLTNIQSNDLAVYVKGMVSENPDSFSLLELFEKFPPKKEQGLRGKLQPLLHLINAHSPKDNKYKHSSCIEFLNDCSKITILSITQDSQPELRSTVYSMLQAIFEHRVIDSSKRLVIYADEIQKYTSDSPFRKLYAESREFNTCMIAMTQEYRATGDDTKKMTSNAAMELFYPPTSDSEVRVSKKLGKKYHTDEHHQKGVGYLWAKGYFWSKTDNRHMQATFLHAYYNKKSRRNRTSFHTWNDIF